MTNKQIVGKILMVLLLVLTLTVAVILVVETRKQNPTMTIGLPSAFLPTPVAKQPLSRWATDSGVLEIEGNLKALSSDVQNTDLKESNLMPPSLDMEIKF